MSAQVLDAGAALRVFATIRLHVLLFSLPYIWIWTQGLAPVTRWAALVAHGCTVVAAYLWNDVADARSGAGPHLGVTARTDAPDVPLARTLAWAIAGAAVVASLGLFEISSLAPFVVIAALAGAWMLARLPVTRKYLTLPEVGGPVLVVVLPAVALTIATDVTAAPSTATAGAAFLSALTVAMHIRDRGRDLRHGIPTLATRHLDAARGWLLLAAVVGVVAGCAAVTTPLSGDEIMRVIGAVTFGVAAAIHRGNVPALTFSHAIFALSLLL